MPLACHIIATVAAHMPLACHIIIVNSGLSDGGQKEIFGYKGGVGGERGAGSGG